MNYDNGVVGLDLLGIVVLFGTIVVLTTFCISPLLGDSRLAGVVIHLACLLNMHFSLYTDRVV
jgi:hypothetical protein